MIEGKKYKIHVEIGQYQFVETEVDDITDLRTVHDQIKLEFQNGPGLDRNKWCKVLDAYMSTRTLSIADYEAMDFDQKRFISEIKRHHSRVDSKKN